VGLEALSPAFLAGARRRVGLVAGLLALVNLVGQVLSPLLWAWGGTELAREHAPGGDLLVMLASALMWGLAVRKGGRDLTVLRLGLAYEVWICFSWSLTVLANSWGWTGQVPEITWAALVVAFFPVVVPTDVRTTLLVSVLAALMVPLAGAVLAGLGMVPLDPVAIGMLGVRHLQAVPVAVLGAAVLHGAALEAARAQALGGYQLGPRIGEGGMGRVHRAEHRLLARPVALKLIHPELLAGDPSRAQARFEAEAKTLASLRSPHTVALYDYGVAEDGSFYAVMELLDGLDLQRLVSRYGPLPPERVVFLLQQACRSLVEAHAAGVVHQDIKPSNLFVCCLPGEPDFLKVLDFGLAARPGGTLAAGTPGYMAPEQILGQPVRPRTDIYGLGCVAFFLLTGERVFGELPLHGQLTRPAAAPSRRVSGLPVELDVLVLRCLAKEPEQRPTSAELAAELAACACAGAWTPARAAAWWEAHQGWVGGSIGAADLRS
jgi:hypothetical protein